MNTYKFNFNMQYAIDLRDAVNDRQKLSIDNMHTDKQTKGEYRAWNRTCAAMDRLEDTLQYINNMELGRNKNARSAFDFYDFINNAFIVIDCIKTIGRIFRINDSLIEKIENSTLQKQYLLVTRKASIWLLCRMHGMVRSPLRSWQLTRIRK